MEGGGRKGRKGEWYRNFNGEKKSRYRRNCKDRLSGFLTSFSMKAAGFIIVDPSPLHKRKVILDLWRVGD